MEDFNLENESVASQPESTPKLFGIGWRLFTLIAVVVFLTVIFALMVSPPQDFKGEVTARIEEGSSLRKVSLQFKNNNLIKSRIAFETLVMFYGDEKKIIAGYYFFERPLGVITLAKRIAKGDRNVTALKITVPEGLDRSLIADLFEARLPLFDREKFLTDSISLEGYLFPDTYFFLPESTESDVLLSMRKNYEQKVGPLREEILKTGKTEREILIMASIIERESNGEEDRGDISGILWKRIKIGMALQVDAWPETYEKRGLPTDPIANPGLSSIRASIYPVESKYLYYLHDKKGVVHYARSFEEHKSNIDKFLR